MNDTIKTNRTDGFLHGQHNAFDTLVHHSGALKGTGDWPNIAPFIVICTCVTLIILAAIVGFFLLKWQKNDIKAKKDERNATFEHSIKMEAISSYREGKFMLNDENRKNREFLIALNEKLKVIKETATTTTNVDGKPDTTTEKTEHINERVLDILITKIKGLSI